LDRLKEERPHLLPLPEMPFEPRKVIPVSIGSRAVVKVEGAWYSVPSDWKRLPGTAYVGVDTVRIVCRGETEVYERQRFGGKEIRYRHYLTELAKKPQAVRQVAPELIEELGEPYGPLWKLLVSVHGGREAGRVLARILGAVVEHGEEPVARALESSLKTERVDLLALSKLAQNTEPPLVPVPAGLAGYTVEAASVETYDAILAGGAP